MKRDARWEARSDVTKILELLQTHPEGEKHDFQQTRSHAVPSVLCREPGMLQGVEFEN